MIQTRLTLQRGPWIGERAAYFLREGVVAVGTIVDIRTVNDPPTSAVFIAVLGWPNLGVVPTDQYQEIRGACSHSRGFNAAGLCFDCSPSPIVPSPIEAP